MKKLLALLLAVCLVISSVPAVFAAELTPEETIEELLSSEYSATEEVDPGEPNCFQAVTTQVNPRYAALGLTSDDLVFSSASYGTHDEPVECDSYEQAVVTIREALKLRETPISVKFTVDPAGFDIDTFSGIVFGAAIEHTGVPTEGDYLAWQYGGYMGRTTYWDYTDYYEVLLDYEVPYYSSAEQEAVIDAQLPGIMASLNLDGLTESGKAKAIYDYICANVTYDYDNLNNDAYPLKYTAYAALINKTAVCQGYALLFYRMALTAGLDARFISGIGNGGPHGWNIVRIGDKYYNLDSTWDAGQSEYGYFLKCNANFDDHTRNPQFTTESFNSEYPMSATDWVECTSHVPVTDPAVPATCTKTGLTKGSHCSVCGEVLQAQTTVPAKGHSFSKGKCTVCGAADPSVQTVNHRLYNPYTLEHMFCSDETERQNLLSIGWTYDGIAFMTPGSGKPVYRLYNPAGDWHTYSADSIEIANLESQGWSVDGVMCFSADSNGRAVYRMYNPYEAVNYLLFTSGAEERDWLVTLGWVYQGIAWYVEK